MWENHRRVVLFCGNLGSGKTEIAINYSLFLRRQKNKPVSLADVDIINPYFRSRKARQLLEASGVRVVCPEGELASADIPALPPAILGLLENPEISGVFDVGGDDTGATVLGRFKPYLPEGSYDLFFVVNTHRPYTRNVDGIIDYLTSIERASRLKATALVNNSNLGPQTGIATVLEGQEIVNKAAEKLEIPVAFTASLATLVPELENRLAVPVLPLDLYMRPPWSI